MTASPPIKNAGNDLGNVFPAYLRTIGLLIVRAG